MASHDPIEYSARSAAPSLPLRVNLSTMPRSESTQGRAARVGKKRPWTVPGAPHAQDSLEVLQEVPGTLGLELWMIVRHVRLWAECPPEQRPKLFVHRAARHVAERRTELLNESPAQLRNDLRVLMRVCAPVPPDAVRIAAACEAITAWAQAEGYRRTAVHFAEAVAALCPKDAHAAFVAARTNRLAGESWRGELFYARAIRFAHREQAWSVYVRAHLGMGRLLLNRGSFRLAAKHYFTAATKAFDQGEEWLSAQTFHDLLALSLEQGLSGGPANGPRFGNAESYAREALTRYPRHHERFPAAVHDFAFLLVCQYRYADALPLLEVLMEAPIPMHDQVIGWSTLARTAASLGDAERYGVCETRVLALAPHHDLHMAAALINLAFGARALGDWSLAESYARRGILAGEAKGDAVARHVGGELLAEIERREPAPTPARRLHGGSAGPSKVDELVALLADQLAAWRGPTWTRKESQSGVATLGPV